MEEEEEEVWWLVEEKDDVLGVGTYWYWGKEVGGKMYFLEGRCWNLCILSICLYCVRFEFEFRLLV